MGKFFIWFVRSALGGLLSYGFPRVLISAGVPLDKWIVQFSHWVSRGMITIPAADAAWIATCLFFLLLAIMEYRWGLVELLVGFLSGAKTDALSYDGPDMPLHAALDYIANESVWGGKSEVDGLQAVKELKDQVALRRLRVWGRDIFQGDVPLEIPLEEWKFAEFDYTTIWDETCPDGARGTIECPNRSARVYRHLRVNKGEVLTVWPPRETSPKT